MKQLGTWRVWGASILLLAGGCARFEPLPLRPGESARVLETRSLTEAGLRQFLERNLGKPVDRWPLQEWDFPKLALAALYFHPSLEVARSEWRVAKAGELTAGARPNLTLSVAPGFTANAERGLSPWLAAIDFEVPIETAGKRGYRLAQARHLTEAARLKLAVTAWKIRGELRQSLIELKAAGRRESLLEEQQRIQQEILQRMEARRAAGAIASSELLPARLALNKTIVDLGDARRQREEARARAAGAMGLPLEALAGTEPRIDPPAVVELDPPALRRQALLGRPDVLAALAEYAASQSALQLEIARQYPDLRLGPGYEYRPGRK